MIDTPPKLDVSVHDPKARCELLAAACLADAVVVPVEPAYFNLWACDNTFTVLSNANAIREQLRLPPAERFVVLNKADERTKVTKLARESLQKTPGFVDCTVHNRTLFVQVTGVGESVLTMEPDGAAAQEIRDLYAATQGASHLATQGAELIAPLEVRQ